MHLFKSPLLYLPLALLFLCIVLSVLMEAKTPNTSHPLPQHHNHASLPSTTILITITTLISVVLLLTISLIIVKLRRLNHPKKEPNLNNDICINQGNIKFTPRATVDFNSSPDVKGGCLYGTQSSRFSGVQVFAYKELEVATSKFSKANVIGNGGFGVVYRGVLRDGTVAAIKRLRRQGKHGERAFRVEVDLLSNLHSPQLVELLGYCADQHHRLLIFEFIPNGNLHHHLHDQKQPLDWRTRLRIALDCARALEFLHGQPNPPVIHGDFNCTNILLDMNFHVKVSDFGSACRMGSDRIDGQISNGHLAPEYGSTGKVTTKTDVYSYGVVVVQLLTGRTPVDSNRPPTEQVLVSWALPRLTNRKKLMEMVDPSLQSNYSKKQLIQVAAIAAMCVQTETKYRPIMTDVVQSLLPLVNNHSPIPSSTSFRFLNRIASPSS